MRSDRSLCWRSLCLFRAPCFFRFRCLLSVGRCACRDIVSVSSVPPFLESVFPALLHLTSPSQLLQPHNAPHKGSRNIEAFTTEKGVPTDRVSTLYLDRRDILSTHQVRHLCNTPFRVPSTTPRSFAAAPVCHALLLVGTCICGSLPALWRLQLDRGGPLCLGSSPGVQGHNKAISR